MKDRIVLRGSAAQLAEAVSRARRWLGGTVRVLLPDGRSLDARSSELHK